MFPLVPSHGAAKRIEKVPESVYIITGLKLERCLALFSLESYLPELWRGAVQGLRIPY
jgi:hypothetical protein